MKESLRPIEKTGLIFRFRAMLEELMKRAKRYGFSDRQMGEIIGQSEEIRAWPTEQRHQERLQAR